MPQSQVAVVQAYDFGAPAVAGEVLKFRTKRGGKLQLSFENSEGLNDGTVSVEVSEDGTTFVATTAANNLVAVTNEVIKRGTHREFAILLRHEKDVYFRVTASGQTRMNVQIRSDQVLEIEKLYPWS